MIERAPAPSPPAESLGNFLARQLLPILALLFSTAFLLAANGLHSLLLPIRGALEGFSTNQLGLIGTGWATGFVLGCLIAPVVVRRVGHIRAFSCSAACAATAWSPPPGTSRPAPRPGATTS